MSVLLGVLAVAAAGGWKIEYTAYPNAGGTQAIYVRGKVRTTRNVDTSLQVAFNRQTNSSTVQGDSGDVYAMYFDHVGFLLPASDVLPPGIAFQDFDTGKGAYIGMGTIGSGGPQPHAGSRIIAQAACAGPIETCEFGGSIDGKNISFYVSQTQTYHSVSKSMADTVTYIRTSDGVVVVDTREYDAYEDVFEENQRVAILSIPHMKVTLWQNSTHAQIWEQPNAMNSMHDLVSMLLMVGALVAIVDISSFTTQRMATVPCTAYDVSWLTCVVMFDISTSAAFIVGYKIYSGGAFVDTRVHGIDNKNKELVAGIALAAITIAAAVIAATVADVKYNFLLDKASWWVWSRGTFEASVVLAASSSAPSVVGGSFVLAMRFATGLVAVAVLGRDITFVLRNAPWKIALMALVHAAMFEWIIAEALAEPVFWLSQSFPRRNQFTRMISHSVVLCTATGAAGSLAPSRGVARTKDGCTYVQPGGQETFSML